MPAAKASDTRYSVDTDAIRHINSLADVVERDIGRPTRQGNLLAWSCPFHTGDRTPSLKVYRDDHYHCFACGAHGDVITWTMRRKGLAFIDACRELDPTISGMQHKRKQPHNPVKPDLHLVPEPETPSEQWQNKALEIAAECESVLWDKQSKVSAEIRAYLAGRGLQETILQDFFVGYNPTERYYQDVRLWIPAGITIPTWHAATNTLYGLNVRLTDQARNSWKVKTGNDAKYLLASGSKRAPLGLESIADKQCAFVVEGEFDTLLILQTLRAMGQKAANIGAFTMGSASSQDVERWLLLHREFLDPARYLIATDRDKAGERAAKHWLEITPGRARLWPPPRPCKDVTELWQKHGYEGVRWWILEGLKRHNLN